MGGGSTYFLNRASRESGQTLGCDLACLPQDLGPKFDKSAGRSGHASKGRGCVQTHHPPTHPGVPHIPVLFGSPRLHARCDKQRKKKKTARFRYGYAQQGCQLQS